MSVVSQLLTDLFNQRFDEGYYASDLKTARVIAIYKDGSVEFEGNYRSIKLKTILKPNISDYYSISIINSILKAI